MQTAINQESANNQQLDWCIEWQCMDKTSINRFASRNDAELFREQLRADRAEYGTVGNGGHQSIRLAKASRLNNDKLPVYKPRIPKLAYVHESWRSAESVVNAYIAWAKSKRLQCVHVYPIRQTQKHFMNDRVLQMSLSRDFEVITVDPADYM